MRARNRPKGRMVGDFLRQSRGRMAIGLLFSLVNAAITWITPWPLKIVVDSVFGTKPLPSSFGYTGTKLELLYITVGAMGALALIGGVSTYISALSFANAGQIFSNNLQVRVYDHILKQPQGFFEKRKAGDLSTRLIADVQSIQRAMVESVPTLVNSILAIVGIMIILAMLGVVFLVAVLALGVFVVFDLTYFMRRVRRESRRARDYEGMANSAAQQAITGLVVVQTNGATEMESFRFSSLVKLSTRHSLNSNIAQAAMNSSVTSVLNLTIAGFVLFSGLAVFSHTLSLGMILVVTSYARSVYKPLQQLTKRAGIVGVGLAAKERVEELLLANDARPGVTTKRRVPLGGSSISYEGVAFSHGGRSIFEDLNLRVEEGKRIAIVGETGSGKSTIAKMLPRLLEPKEGRVTIGGRSLDEIPSFQLRELVAYLPQETFIFSGTIWENVIYGLQGAIRLDAVRSCYEAGVMEVFKVLPMGIDTVVSEKGTSLSGGQRQCIAIARTVAKNARIIILDEPTVGVDPQLEEVLCGAFERVTKGRTAIVISHQEKTLRFCDEIYRFRDGRLQKSTFEDFFLSSLDRQPRQQIDEFLSFG
ncbi:ABC transporter ATP-binding protein [Acidithrix sp. C25]|uniref:ABC transporter ATP-binding protein n=1 Tax=Acidithrix sp. C25 TaxID=1671482 RepID=UPI00191BB8F6|nr:ABC transporter ATP-binding protein [Acidithrix sp. C25]